jgi:hypothetical protein
MHRHFDKYLPERKICNMMRPEKMRRRMRQHVHVVAASFLAASDYDHYRRSEKRIGDYCEDY